MLSNQIENMTDEVEEILTYPDGSKREIVGNTYPTGLPDPLGPTVLVKLLLPNQFLKNSKFKLLEEKGFETSSEELQVREKKGGDIAVVLAFGPMAYKKVGRGACNSPEEWGVKVNDTVQLRTKYMGKEIENDETNQSGHLYRLVYDDEIIGIYTGKEYW